MEDSKTRAAVAHYSLEQAVHFAAKNYVDGIDGIARAYGFNATTFQHKLNPVNPGSPNLKEFEAVLRATGSNVVLDAIGRITNCMFIPLNQFDHIGDMAVLDTVTQLVQRVGQMTGDLQKALADKKVTKRELRQLENDFAQIAAAGYAVVERAKQFMVP